MHLLSVWKFFRLEQNDLHDLQIAYTKITHCHCASLGLRCSIFFVIFPLAWLLYIVVAIGLFIALDWLLEMASTQPNTKRFCEFPIEIKITRTHATHTHTRSGNAISSMAHSASTTSPKLWILRLL